MKMQATDPELETLIGRIRRKAIDLQPNFQRGEVWTVGKKKRLIDSILRGWHVPPLHLVVRGDGLHEVLDGQQRLVAIRDFMDGAFSIDGTLEPVDDFINSLHGLRFSRLPPAVKLAFESFTIRTFLLTDYQPEEPGELFFRLNQIASLTSAEQRNAFYGVARDQVKYVVSLMDTEANVATIGFSNKRMAYDDIVSKFLFLCEQRTLLKKTTAGELSARFRSKEEFEARFIADVTAALAVLIGGDEQDYRRPRLNKASMLSWLLFLHRARQRGFGASLCSNYVYLWGDHLTPRKIEGRSRPQHSSEIDGIAVNKLVQLFIDRSSFRVSDVSSVVIRDLVLWSLFYLYLQRNAPNDAWQIETTAPPEEWSSLNQVIRMCSGGAEAESLDESIEAFISEARWGALL